MSVIMKRTAQVGCKAESTLGTEETLAAAEFSRNRRDTTRTASRQQYERELEDGTSTPKAMLVGMRDFAAEYAEEMVGKESAVPWWETVQGLGFLGTAVKMVVTGALTGTAFATGQTIGNHATLGSATATGYVVHYNAGNPGALWYVPVAGAFADTDVVYNYESSQGSADCDSTPADKGYRYRPATERDGQTLKGCTCERRIGGYRHTGVACVATGSLRLALGEPPMLRAQFQGLPVYDGSGNVRTGSLVTGLTTLDPPTSLKALAAVVKQGATAKTLVFSEVEFGLDNTIARRPDVTSNALVASGQQPPRITARRFTATISAEHDPATLDAIGLANNATTLAVTLPIGATDGAHGMLVVHAPALQIDGDLSPGDREGIETDELSFVCTGTDDDELEISHIWE